MTCPKCQTEWSGENTIGAHGRCTGCGVWLVVDRPQSQMPQPPRLYAYTTRESGKTPGVHDGQVMVECPFCGVVHTHGYVEESDGTLGYRVSHCSSVNVPGHGWVSLRPGGGYRIVLEDGVPTAIPA